MLFRSKVTPALHNFGTVLVGNTKELNVTVENNGSATLNVTAAAISGSSTMTVDTGGGGSPCGTVPFAITAGGTCTVGVTFAPTASGGVSGSLNFTTDGGDGNVSLLGTGSASGLYVSSLNSSVTNGYAPLAVTFAIGAGGGSGSYTYSWDFNDTGSSTSQNPTHTFTSVGTYDVLVTVTDANDSFLTTTGTVRITVQYAPLAFGSYNVSPAITKTGTPVEANATLTGGSGTYTYSWDFDDGTVLIGSDVSHSYSTEGNFTVGLTATDGVTGNILTASWLVVVDDTAASPVFFTSLSAQPVAGVIPLDVNFSAAATGGSGSYSYLWSFGDGNSTTSTLQSPSFTYTTEGNYTVTVKLTDVNDSSNTQTASMTVIALAAPASYDPLALESIAITPAAGNAPLSPTFSVTVSGGSGSYSYLWDFGDGNSSTLQSPSYTYTTEGNYTVTYTVTDVANNANVLTGTFLVQVLPLSSATGLIVSAEPDSGTLPLSVTVDANVTGSYSSSYAVTWQWGDGTYNTTSETGSGFYNSHTYTQAGTYQVAVTIVGGGVQLTGTTTVQVLSASVMDSGKRENGESDGGYCFIATAAYGSYLEPEVRVLRQFRDNYLLSGKIPGGQAFVRYYYTYSPPFAAYIAEREWLRTMVRGALTPLVLGVKYPWAVAGMILLGVAGWRRRKRHANVTTIRLA